MLRVLDLFCGAGGAGMGYKQAGYTHIVGVDHKPQKHYPFTFIEQDALEYLAKYGHLFDLIHASPPCQRFSKATAIHSKEHQAQHVDYIDSTRELLKKLGKPYVIENVVGAPLKEPIKLCGTMFDLLVIRHRLFETYPKLPAPKMTCNHVRKVVDLGRKPDPEIHYASVVGHFVGVDFARKAMGIDWMVRDELSQAIPPAYTKYIGQEMKRFVESRVPRLYDRGQASRVQQNHIPFYPGSEVGGFLHSPGDTFSLRTIPFQI